MTNTCNEQKFLRTSNCELHTFKTCYCPMLAEKQNMLTNVRHESSKSSRFDQYIMNVVYTCSI